MRFWIILILFAALIFLLNANHIQQQGIFIHYYTPIAQNVLTGSGYSIDGHPAYYPMWGYTFLTALGVPVLTLIQFALSIVGIWFFYKLFEITPKWWHLFLFIPYFSAVSVKWALAIILPLIIVSLYCVGNYLETDKPKYLIFAAILFGIILNSRSEYLLYPSLVFVALFVAYLTATFKVNGYVLLAFAITYLSLAGWYIHSGQTTSTGSGLVSYISLGQLPNNSWGIKHADSFGMEQIRGYDAFSKEGDKMLTDKFIEAVKSKPSEYALKCFDNAIGAVLGGVFTFEASTFFFPTQDKAYEASNRMYGKTRAEKREILDTLTASQRFGFYLEWGLTFIFRIVFVVLLAMFLYNVSKNRFDWVGLSFVLYSFALIILLQYEPRHLNIAYMLIMGNVLQQKEIRNAQSH